MEEQEATIAELKSSVAQHKKEFEATVAQQEKGIAALAATIREGGVLQIQKVSAQLEASKPATQMVNSNVE